MQENYPPTRSSHFKCQTAAAAPSASAVFLHEYDELDLVGTFSGFLLVRPWFVHRFLGCLYFRQKVLNPSSCSLSAAFFRLIRLKNGSTNSLSESLIICHRLRHRIRLAS